MKKKKFLLVEFTAHYRNSLDNFKFFQNFFDCYFLISKKHKNYINLKKNKIVFKFPEFLILFYVIITGYKYKFIYFSTPPENPDYPKGILANLFFIYNFLLYNLILFLYKDKIIFQLRGLHRYFPDINSKLRKPTIYSYLRNIYLRKCKNIVCESRFLKNQLIKKFRLYKINNKKILVLYYTYPKKDFNFKLKYPKKKLNIGILGSVTDFRKDYSILFELLKEKFFIKKKITLIFLGAANTNFAKEKINRFKKYCHKTISKNYFTEEEFLRFGKKTDLLLSLNNKKNFYGKYRLSACFGDAILLKKPLYCPNFEDPAREFSSFTTYFNQTHDIIDHIEKFSEKKQNISFNLLNLKENLQLFKNELK